MQWIVCLTAPKWWMRTQTSLHVSYPTYKQLFNKQKIKHGNVSPNSYKPVSIVLVAPTAVSALFYVWGCSISDG